MAIRFQHQVAGVVPSSNQSTRKYGQSLVLNQQRANLNTANLMQQAGMDMQKQLASDFDNASDRIDTFAKEALKNPDLPQEVRQQIQNSLAGKMAVLGAGFDPMQRQQYLRQHNARLGGLLSEIPAPAPQPKVQEPATFKDAYKADPKAINDSYTRYLNGLTDGGSRNPTTDDIKNAWKLAEDEWKVKSGLDTTPPNAPPAAQPGAPPAGAGAAMQQPPGGMRNVGWKQPLPDYGNQVGIANLPDYGQTPGIQPQGGGMRWDGGLATKQPPATWTGNVDPATGHYIFSNGARVDPRDDIAMKSGGAMSNSMYYRFNPNGTPIQPTRGMVDLESTYQGQPVSMPQQGPQTVLGQLAPEMLQAPTQGYLGPGSRGEPIREAPAPGFGAQALDYLKGFTEGIGGPVAPLQQTPQVPPQPQAVPQAPPQVQGGMPPAQPQSPATQPQPQQVPQQTQPITNWQYPQQPGGAVVDPSLPPNPVQTPMGTLPNVGGPIGGFASLPQGQREEFARRGALRGMTEQQAFEYAQQNPWAGIPNAMKQKYEANLKSGQTKMTPQEAAKYYWENHYTKSPMEHQKALAAEGAAGVDAKVASAQKQLDDTRNLAQVGKPDYTDYNDKTGRRNKRMEENNARMEAENERQRKGGGLKYQQPSTGFGTPEQGAQAASNFNNLAAAEQAKKDAYNAEQDALMAKHAQGRITNNAKDATTYGVQDGEQMGNTKWDLNKLTAEFSVFQKANPTSNRMKFVDFVQAKINNGEIPYGDDMLKVISKNYGVQFKAPQPSVAGASPVDDSYKTGSANRDQWRDSRQAAREEKKQGRKYGGQQAQATAAGKSVDPVGDELKQMRDTAEDPQVKSAMEVLLNPKSTDAQFSEAMDFLKKRGIKV